MIPVTKSYLPNTEKYKAYVDQIFDSGWLTNNGPLVKELEKRLASHLRVKHLVCVANGSLAMQVAYKALGLSGEVITTPFSFVATTNTLLWEGVTPVFADINPKTYNLDPTNIDALITEKTSAILPVHVYGNPCEVEKIQSVAAKNDLKVIYDAAHAFDVEYKKQSVLNYGDISAVSFHATKLFHSIEGGAIVTRNDELAEKIRQLINFGFTGPISIDSIGTNAKMNELEAAMGLCVLDDIETIKQNRAGIWQKYQERLAGLVDFQEWNKESLNNYAYAPVLFESEKQLLKIETKLKANEIYPRRYFYPSLNNLKYMPEDFECHMSNDIAKRILCLPMYCGLKSSDQDRIISLIKGCL